MRNPLLLLLISSALVSACSAPGGPYPSLQPRPAEKTDPRVPVQKPINDRPVSPGLAAKLASLIGQARRGDAEFQAAADRADKAAVPAGAQQSENWVIAEEALSVAVAARGSVGSALGDIDGLAAVALQTNGGIAPNDLAALNEAAAEVGAIDRREADRLRAIQDRLRR